MYLEDPIRTSSPHGWVQLQKEMKEVNDKMKYGSRYLYSSPEEIEKLTVIPEAWIKKMAEKARLAKLAAEKEALENSSRPTSK